LKAQLRSIENLSNMICMCAWAKRMQGQVIRIPRNPGGEV
jgi:hypothetical protein